MVDVIFDKKEPISANLDLCDDLEPGPVNREKVKGNLKTLVDRLEPGRLCVTESYEVNGNSISKNYNLFRVGEQGLFLEKRKDRNVISIDVEQRVNTCSMVNEARVLKKGSSGYNWNHTQSSVSLSLGGIKHMQFYNEFTFSPAPGGYIDHPFGSYMNSITVGQEKIKDEWNEALKELDYLSEGVPFVLPSEYLRQGPGSIVEMHMEAAKSVIRTLWDEGILEKPLNREEREEIYSNMRKYSNKPEEREYREELIKKIRSSDESKREQEKLWKLFGNKIRTSNLESITLNAVGSLFRDFSFCCSENGYRVQETNPRLEDLGENHPSGKRYKPYPRKVIDLIPSKLMPNTVYAIPADGESNKCVIEKLFAFNREYPDNNRIEGHKENYVPISVLR